MYPKSGLNNTSETFWDMIIRGTHYGTYFRNFLGSDILSTDGKPDVISQRREICWELWKHYSEALRLNVIRLGILLKIYRTQYTWGYITRTQYIYMWTRYQIRYNIRNAIGSDLTMGLIQSYN